MKSLSQIKPQLKPVSIVIDEERLLLEDVSGANQLALPLAAKPLVDLLDGSRTIKDVVASMLGSNGMISFRELFGVLKSLDDAKLFVEPIGLSNADSVARAPLERSEAFFMRPLLKLTLLKRLRVSLLEHRSLLLVAVAAIVAVSVGTLVFWSDNYSSRGIFRIAWPGHGLESYAFALPVFFAMASALMMAKGLIKAVLLLLGTGQFSMLTLRLHAFGVSLGVSDTGVQSLSGGIWIFLYFLGCASSYVFVATLFSELVRDQGLVRSFDVLALLLTFIDLDAYRRSDLTVLIDRLFPDQDTRHLTAYLKNRALLSVATVKQGIQGELRLVVYSSLALLWTLGFCFFALDVLSSNYANLFLVASDQGPLKERLSAIALLAMFGSVFGALAFDLLSTIARNLIFPVLTPYLKLLQKVGSRDDKSISRADLLKALREISFFQELSDEALGFVVESARVKSFRRNTRLIIQGEPGRELFVLLKGSVNVLKREETGLQTQICQLGAGSVFGEIALLKECVRTADVVAHDDISALIIEKQAFQQLVSNTSFQGDYDRILDRIALGHYLSSAALFRGMPAETLGLFRELGTFEHHDSGEEIIKEGAEDRAFYLVLRGRLVVTRLGQPVAELKQGDFFGEIALLCNVPRTATVSAVEETLLLKLESAAFWQVVSENIALAMNLEMVAERRRLGQDA